MNIKQRILWISRAIEYSFRYYFIEKPHGLDFSLRSRDKKSSVSSSGYALTSKKALKNILSDIPIDSSSRFIDVGGGKGGTAIFSLELGFLHSASLEFEEYLHNIAKKNVSILNLEDRIRLIHVDAFQYHGYGEYSHIFMFRPLNGTLMRDLLKHISMNIKESTSKKIYILIYGGVPFEYINEVLLLNTANALVKNEICPYRGNEIRVIEVKC